MAELQPIIVFTTPILSAIFEICNPICVKHLPIMSGDIARNSK